MYRLRALKSAFPTIARISCPLPVMIGSTTLIASVKVAPPEGAPGAPRAVPHQSQPMSATGRASQPPSPWKYPERSGEVNRTHNRFMAIGIKIQGNHYRWGARSTIFPAFLLTTLGILGVSWFLNGVCCVFLRLYQLFIVQIINWSIYGLIEQLLE